MAVATLTISSRNYSSWSLRGWLLTRMSGLPFDEVVVPITDPENRAELLLLSPSVLVPEAEQDGPLIAGVSPSAAARAGLGDGEMAALVSPRGRLEVRLRCDATLRPDLVVLPKGGWHKHGRNMNVLVEPRFTAGTGSAFNENFVRVEKA